MQKEFLQVVNDDPPDADDPDAAQVGDDMMMMMMSLTIASEVSTTGVLVGDKHIMSG